MKNPRDSPEVVEHDGFPAIAPTIFPEITFQQRRFGTPDMKFSGKNTNAVIVFFPLCCPGSR